MLFEYILEIRDSLTLRIIPVYRQNFRFELKQLLQKARRSDSTKRAEQQLLDQIAREVDRSGSRISVGLVIAALVIVPA